MIKIRPDIATSNELPVFTGRVDRGRPCVLRHHRGEMLITPLSWIPAGPETEAKLRGAQRTRVAASSPLSQPPLMILLAVIGVCCSWLRCIDLLCCCESVPTFPGATRRGSRRHQSAPVAPPVRGTAVCQPAASLRRARYAGHVQAASARAAVAVPSRAVPGEVDAKARRQSGASEPPQPPLLPRDDEERQRHSAVGGQVVRDGGAGREVVDVPVVAVVVGEPGGWFRQR